MAKGSSGRWKGKEEDEGLLAGAEEACEEVPDGERRRE